MSLPTTIKIRGRLWSVCASARTGEVVLTSFGARVGSAVRFDSGTWQDLRDRKIEPSESEVTAAWQSAFERAVKAARKYQ